MKKRKVFRSHILLVIEGRLFLILMIATAVWLPVTLIYSTIISPLINHLSVDLIDGIVIVLFDLVWLISTGFLCHIFWRSCFEKLIVTSKYIEWRCLFCRRIVLPVDEIKYVKPCAFLGGNVMKDRDAYKTGFRYVLISTEPLPNKRIDKIRSKGKLIRFMLNDALCEALSDVFPEKRSCLSSYVIGKKAKRKK